MTIYETIKAAVSVKQTAEHYGLKAGRNGMACCPFHNDRHPSLKLNEDYFFCFGCGAKGDVIDLVARLFNMSSYEAAQKLASDFGLDPKPPTAAAMAKPKRPYIRQFRENEMLCFRVLTDYLHLLEDWKVRYAPKTPTLSFHRFNISVTGYRFELTTGDTPKCALFFIGKFQGDKAAKDYLTSLGFTLKDKKDKQLGKANYEFTAGTVFPDMPAEEKESTSEVVRSGDAYLFEAYLMRSFDKENHNGYTEEIGATAQATFDNGGKQDSETQWLSFEDAWKNAEISDSAQQEILDNFLQKLGITKQTE